MWRDAETAHLERLARVAFDELHFRRHVAQPHWKVGRVHLVGEGGLQRLGRSRRPDDRQVRAWDKGREEEREALDVVEMGVSDEQVGLKGIGRAESIAQL